MAARRILLLDANHLTAFRWQSDGPVEEGRYTPDDAGYAAFGEYLQRQRSSLFYLLADVADEGFQIEDLPHVRGSDRRELISRKLSQLYYGTPLSMAIPLGRAKQGRRDEKILFAGLTGHAHVGPWLQAMRTAEAQLVGVFSLPQVVAGLFGRSGNTADRVLVITIGRAGLRQTFFESGQLRFSRLAPIAIARIDDVAAACANETNKIYQYLAGQRLISRDTPLKTLVLAHPDHFSTFADRCHDTPERQVEILDLTSLGKKYGLKGKPKDSNSENLFLHVLGRQQPSQQFAPESDRHFYRLWQARFGMRTAAAAIIVGGLLFGGVQAFNLDRLTATNSEARSDVELNQHRYDAMLHGLPRIPISMEELRALTDRDSVLVKRSPGPEPLLHHISRALTKVPRVDLTKLQWHLANSPDEDAPPGIRNTAIAKTGSSSGSGGIGGYAIVDLQAQLPAAMATDHRSQLEAVDALVAALSGAGVQIKIVSLPFETESGKSIRSGETAAAAEPPKFVLRMVQRL